MNRTRPSRARTELDLTAADTARWASMALVSAAWYLHAAARRTARTMHGAADQLVTAAFWLDARHETLEEKYR